MSVQIKMQISEKMEKKKLFCNIHNKIKAW